MTTPSPALIPLQAARDTIEDNRAGFYTPLAELELDDDVYEAARLALRNAAEALGYGAVSPLALTRAKRLSIYDAAIKAVGGGA